MVKVWGLLRIVSSEIENKIVNEINISLLSLFVSDLQCTSKLVLLCLISSSFLAFFVCLAPYCRVVFKASFRLPGLPVTLRAVGLYLHAEHQREAGSKPPLLSTLKQRAE